ncbi:MAG: DUF2069 domain-containing protein [Burkholderiaceae bacterium]
MANSSATVSATPDRITSATRAIAVAATIALIALSIAWELVWARTGHGTLVWKALPLVLALPGLLRHRMYTYRWLSLAIWLYVAEGLVRIVDKPPANWCAAAEVALSIVLFTACATQVRWRHTVARRLAAADDPRADAGTAH